MARFFHGLTRTVILICLTFLFCGTATLAGEAAGDRDHASSSAGASRQPASGMKTGAPAGVKSGRRFVRRKSCRVSRRAHVRRTGKAADNRAANRMWSGKARTAKRSLAARMATSPVKPTVATKKAAAQTAVVSRTTRKPAAVDMAPDMVPAVSPAVGDGIQVVESVAYEFAGYTATADGATVKLWYSHAYTVRSPYAYLGRMPVGGREVHVWMETAGTLLASAVTGSAQEPLPDVARMMERFPDGGLGVVVAGWDDFAPPAEPAVEVVEFTEPGR
ncbi:hypothetical protein J8C02_12430 [Chloracidobacterium sp. MS 40/45]|jgi:hypothetical protein|uniref:hypothetical protein n=1 Tax=Chloracidobacterium aggregatum TaxID=2851959 RepID=UPI001B8B4A2A|nr:hypothetical protein [Chloracidobacterium aggregatum]QUW01693.1 hypothetical protein J8C02_12430 [Chloracidobacterium sp. MS 40/45]